MIVDVDYRRVRVDVVHAIMVGGRGSRQAQPLALIRGRLPALSFVYTVIASSCGILPGFMVPSILLRYIQVT